MNIIFSLRKTIFIGASAGMLLYLSSCKGKAQPEADSKKQVCITDSLSKIIKIDTMAMLDTSILLAVIQHLLA